MCEFFLKWAQIQSEDERINSHICDFMLTEHDTFKQHYDRITYEMKMEGRL